MVIAKAVVIVADILFTLLILFGCTRLDKKEDTGTLIGFAAMVITMLANIYLLWC